jgi:hypothetical protein
MVNRDHGRRRLREINNEPGFLATFAAKYYRDGQRAALPDLASSTNAFSSAHPVRGAAGTMAQEPTTEDPSRLARASHMS